MIYKSTTKQYMLLTVCYGAPMGIVFGLMYGSLAVGIISGAACGLLYGLLMFLISRGLEKKFDKKRAEIAGERKIICDGAATVHGNGGWLFLTEYGLEFYPHKVNLSRQEMLIPISKLESVRINGRNQILLATKDYANAIAVVVTHNKEWQKQITDAIANSKVETVNN